MRSLLRVPGLVSRVISEVRVAQPERQTEEKGKEKRIERDLQPNAYAVCLRSGTHDDAGKEASSFCQRRHCHWPQVMEDWLPPSWPQLTRMLILLYIFHLLRRASSSGCRPALLPPRRRPLRGARQREVECHAAYVHFSSSQEEDMEFL